MMGVAPRGTTLPEVSLAAAPYVGAAILLVIIMAFYPPIATFLPGLMQ